jgi:hypothetical protein
MDCDITPQINLILNDLISYKTVDFETREFKTVELVLECNERYGLTIGDLIFKLIMDGYGDQETMIYDYIKACDNDRSF